jgi:hypothetical protein
MPANECIPYKEEATTVTAKAKAAVKGKRFVKVGGNRTGGGGGGAEGSVTVGVGLSTDLENIYQVEPTVAGNQAVGVAGWDTPVNGEVKVYLKGKGFIVPVTAGAAITAGAEVESDAEGRAVTVAAGKPLGMAMNGVTEAGKDAEILLY